MVKTLVQWLIAIFALAMFFFGCCVFFYLFFRRYIS